MNAAVDFEWPKVLRPIKAAAEAGALEARSLYPVEVKALCDLVAGVPLDESPRAVAPGMTATRRREVRAAPGFGKQARSAWYFIGRLDGGRVWQCSLFSDWIFSDCDDAPWTRGPVADTALSPRSIVQALTRAIADRGPK
jgi:hypothetical protein